MVFYIHIPCLLKIKQGTDLIRRYFPCSNLLKVPTGTNCAQIVRPLNVRPNALFYFIRYDRRNSGASRGIRTLDTWFRRPVLYPLSYRRLTSVIIAYGEKIRKGKRCLAFARQEDTKQIPLSSSTGSFKTIFLQILSGCVSGRT